jgi:hypothetical protein
VQPIPSCRSWRMCRLRSAKQRRRLECATESSTAANSCPSDCPSPISQISISIITPGSSVARNQPQARLGCGIAALTTQPQSPPLFSIGAACYLSQCGIPRFPPQSSTCGVSPLEPRFQPPLASEPALPL